MNYKGEGDMDIISFDIKARFGSFTKPFSTTGGVLTYKVPPKTAVRGMLGSMAGFDFESTLSYLRGIKIGIIPLSKTRTKTTTFNSHYGNPRGRMVNIRQEILINPSYRIIADFSKVKRNDNAIEIISNLLEKNRKNKDIVSIAEGYNRLLENNISFYEIYMGRNNFPMDLNTVNLHLERSKNPFGNEFKSNCIVPHEISSDFRVEEKQKEEKSELGLNIKAPQTLKFHIIKDLPVEQKSNREYTVTKNFIMKSIGDSVELLVTPEEKEYGYEYLKDRDNRLYVLF